MTLDEFRSLLDEALAFYNSEHSGAQIDEGVAGGLGAIRYDVVQALAEAQKARARKNLGIDELPSGGGSGPGTFIAVYGQTTSAEIEAAYLAGQTVAVLYENRLGYLIQRISRTEHVFASAATLNLMNASISIYLMTCYSDGWSLSGLDGERIGNKIMAITENSTHIQYPSAKAVYDFVTENSAGGGELSDNAAVAILVETDMLPAVTDGNGAILTVSGQNVLLRF